ncbi:MAG: type II secretion system F family protein [Proteobacteria bacterium]|nr:type II secretion system F family protein [Pseudomonadota bacterium]
MAQYAYRALNDAGRQIRGKLSANNETDLHQQLEEIGLMLIDSKPVKTSALSTAMAKGVSAREKIQFFVHLEQLQAAGVPLLDSLTDVRDSTDTPRLRDLTTTILNDVQGGTPLSQAFEKHPKVFGDLYSALVAAGEESGKLTESFRHLTKHVKWEDAIRQRVKKAARYPAIVMVLIMGMLGFMMGVVVPGIVEFLRSNGTELPPVTLALIATSDFVVNYWHVVLLTPAAVAAVLVVMVKSSETMRYAFSCLALRIPVFGQLITKLAISRFAHFFAVMFQSGVPILQCLETAQRVVTNRCLEESMKTVRQQVQNGEPLSVAMRNSGQFPSLVCRMVKIGEDSGNLGGVMDNVTGFYDKDVDEAIDAMIAMIEPAMTVISGAIMAWIVAGVMGPIYNSLGSS